MNARATLIVDGPVPALSSDVRVPGDKSITHRALFLGALASGPTTILRALAADDVDATIRVLERLGARIGRRGHALDVERPIDRSARDPVSLHCGASGTTARLLLGVVAGLEREVTIDGDPGLRVRPMARVLRPLAAMGLVRVAPASDVLPVRVHGTGALRAREHVLDVASAQVKTALLFAGLSANGVTRVVEPLHTRDHTERMLGAFGARVSTSERAVAVEGPALLCGTTVHVPGDVSAAVALACAAACVPGSRIRLPDVGLNPTRTGALDALRCFGVDVVESDPSVQAHEPRGALECGGTPTHAITVTESEVPRLVDEIPLLAGVAALAPGTSRFLGIGELRVKESDRIETTAATLRAFGVDVETGADSLIVHGPARLRAGDVDSHADHRIAFLAVALALAAPGTSRIRGFEAISKSYPGYLDAIHALLGREAGRCRLTHGVGER